MLVYKRLLIMTQGRSISMAAMINLVVRYEIFYVIQINQSDCLIYRPMTYWR